MNLGGRCCAAILLAAAAVPSRAPAQQPAAVAALSDFRDSLRTVRDTAGLHALEHRLAARRRDDLAALRLGFVELRQGEVEQRRGPFVAAKATFDALVLAHRNWAVAWLGRGLAKLNLADVESPAMRSVHTILSGDPVADAARDIATSAEADTLFVDGLLQVANIALANPHPELLRAALLVMRRAGHEPAARNAAVQLARVRIERIAGSQDSAWRLVSELVQRQPDNPEVLLEAGHVALSRGEDSGAVAWLRGLTLADSTVAAVYRSDLLLLLPDSVMRRFDQTSGAARTGVVEQFLATDPSGEIRSPAARLREHYRRLDHARAEYFIPTDRFHADGVVAFQPRGHDLDDRGLVWVLHGPPDEHTYLNMTGTPPNESWSYQDEGGELLFHFVKTDPAAGYHQVASIFDILSLSTPLRSTGHSDPQAMAARGEAVQTYGASWTAQTVQDALYSRESMSPTYGRMLSAGRKGALELQQAERAVGDSSMKVGETRGVHYELPLDAQVDAIAVGSDSVGQILQVAFAIPGTSLYAAPGVVPVVYPVRMRVSVIRLGTGQLAASIDTLRNFVASEPVPSNGTLFGRLPVRVPPGDYTVRIALETPGRGLMGPRQVIRVAGATRGGLDLSDLALGARSIRLPWRSPRGDSLWVNPSREFRASEPIQLYFEVLGVDRGAAYRYDLAVYRDGDSRPQLQLGFGASAADSPDPVHRELDIGHLKPGSYQLQVTVTAAGGAKVVRRGEFTVVK